MDSTTSANGVLWSRLFGGQSRVAAENKEVAASDRRPLGTNIASLVRDLARMSDLQLQLLSLDLRQFWASARIGLSVSLLAAITILSSLPVLLSGIAGLLEQVTAWSPEMCQLALGAGMTLGGACVMWFAVKRVGNAAKSFKRSQEELAQNLKWVREVLHQDE
ncbi:MAG: phage holin family protein [Planctomycetaceae bacterium]|nr:phage holin family protein [Planctomycetaceae bacterium]